MKIEEITERINNEVNIIDVVSEYAKVERVGKNYRALCPFHPERTPSFYINPQKNLFYCFGCNIGGNVFSFLMKKENLSFFQALNHAASRYLNLDIEDILSKENKLDLGKIRTLLSDTLEFFKKELWETEEGGIALNYLKEERKLKEETILKFNIGYAPADENKLINFLFSLNYTQEDLKEAGLVRISEQGLIYPLFKGRVIFPIFDNLGRIVAFGGRTLDENNISPKYINSPETKLYKKGSIFYGLQFVQKAKEILVVEGYLDLILCHQAGFENTLATLGTAITPLQVNLLKRLTERVVLVFDSDAAGKRAAERGLELISSLGLELEFLFLPKKDAAELLSLNEGEKIFSSLLDKNRQSWQDFLLSYIEDKYNSSKDGAIEELIPFLERLSPIEAHQLISKLEERLKLPSFVLYATFPKTKKIKKKEEIISFSHLLEDTQNPTFFTERLVLQIILEDERLRQDFLGKLKEEYFQHKPFLEVFRYLKKKEGANFSLLDDIYEEGIKNTISKLLIVTDGLKDTKDKRPLLEACINKLERQKLEKEKELILQRIKTTSSISEITKLQKEFLRLKEQINSCEKNHFMV